MYVYREWNISDYIPDIQDRLNTIIQNLIEDKDTLLSIDQSGASPEILTYQIAIDNLLFSRCRPESDFYIPEPLLGGHWFGSTVARFAFATAAKSAARSG